MWHRIRIRIFKLGYIVIGLPLSYATKWAWFKRLLCILLLSIIGIALVIGFEELTWLIIEMFAAFQG